jgi:hypothetical protein
MTTIRISIGTLSVKVRSHSTNDKGPEKDITVEVDWSTLRKSWQTAKDYTVERLRDLVTRYEEHLKQKEEEFKKQWPVHSIFCEKRCCQKSNRTYWSFLKKELVWGKDGHLINLKR